MAEQCKRIHVPHRWGGAKTNIIVSLACIGIVLTMAFSILNRVRILNVITKDQTQMCGIHQSWLVYSREFDGMMPTPGLVDRRPFNGQIVPGRGEEDVSQNTTANLHALCVMQNLYSPNLTVGPTEPNPMVTVFDQDNYNYAAYSPAGSQYWDPAFKADLETGSNVSHAHAPLCGDLRRRQWKASMDTAFPMLGNRGPRDGLYDLNSFTNRIYPPRDQWNGNICFNDNHVEFFTGLSSTPLNVRQQVITQGVFRFDGENDVDGILTFTKAMTPDGPVIQHD